MIKKNTLHLLLVLSFCCSIILGCSPSVKMADIPATADPREEVSKLDMDLQAAVTKNIDVLAASDFAESKKYLDKAQTAIEGGKAQSAILDALRTSRGFLEQAYVVSQNRENKAAGLFAARQMTLNAGAATHPELRKDLAKLDAKVSDNAATLKDTDTETLAEFQQQYVDLERRSVILNQLGKTQALINGAEKENAKKKAPISYKKAELSLKTAESMISTNVRNPQGYQEAVQTSNQDAVQLLNVLNVIQKNGGTLAESVAIQMVAQNKTISGLTTDLGTVTAEGEAAQSAIQIKNRQLAAANSKVQVQRVLELARTQFSNAEAEAYQQGENLVIRLKQVNFASGQAALPATSLALLAKVSEVAKSLNASQIFVEGHTDSVGTASENKTISEQRANAVASYFKTNGFANVKIESEGYGFKKPIATNKSKEGRAQNRRVDVIITPETLAQ